MNTRSRQALILLAVILAVSIAIAAWMGVFTSMVKQEIIVSVPLFEGASHAHAWIDGSYVDTVKPLLLPFNITFSSSLKSFVLKVEYFNQTIYYNSNNVTVYQFVKVDSEQQYIIDLNGEKD